MSLRSLASLAILVAATTSVACGGTTPQPTTPPVWQPSDATSPASAAMRFGAPQIRPGTAWEEQHRVVIDGDVAGLAGLPLEAALRVEKETAGRVEVIALHAQDGMPTQVRIAVTKASEQVEIGPKQRHSREAIEGHEYLAIRDGGWSYERPDGGSVSEEEAKALGAFGLGWRLHPARLLPAGDIREGDHLRLDDGWMAHFGIDGSGLDDITVTFEGPADDAGRFAIAGSFATSKKDIAAQGPFEGALELRPSDSWPLRLDLSSNLALKETDAETPAKGKATLTVSWQAQPE